MTEEEKALAGLVPPVYSDQSQQRGRKPRKTKAAGEKNNKKKNTKGNKTKKKNTRAKKGGKGKKGTKSLKSASKKNTSEDMEEEQLTEDEEIPEQELEKPTKPKRRTRPNGASETQPKRPRKAQDEVTWTVPDDCVPAPPGIPSNLIYSKAYIVQKKLGGEIEDWQNAGKHASWLLRVKGLVSPALSGPAVYKPKTRKPTKDGTAPPGVADDSKKTKEGQDEVNDEIEIEA